MQNYRFFSSIPIFSPRIYIRDILILLAAIALHLHDISNPGRNKRHFNEASALPVLLPEFFVPLPFLLTESETDCVFCIIHGFIFLIGEDYGLATNGAFQFLFNLRSITKTHPWCLYTTFLLMFLGKLMVHLVVQFAPWMTDNRFLFLPKHNFK